MLSSQAKASDVKYHLSKLYPSCLSPWMAVSEWESYKIRSICK
jgi:hypothetical protein